MLKFFRNFTPKKMEMVNLANGESHFQSETQLFETNW